MAKALVLSGGAIKGAFQAGAICELFHRGFEPSGLYGISTGALNAAFLADRAGAQLRSGPNIDWPGIGNELKRFWLNNVKVPADVATQRSWFSIGWSVVNKTFDGLSDTSALRAIVAREINPDNVNRFVNSGNVFSVGAVDMYSGQIFYSENAVVPIRDLVLASAAIPFAFPAVRTRLGVIEGVMVDGGIRDIIPLQRAIKKGFEDIVAVICQPKDFVGGLYAAGDVFRHVERTLDILLAEIMENDVERTSEMIFLARQAAANITESHALRPFVTASLPVLVRPDAMDPVLDVSITDFNQTHIAAMVAKGEEAVRRLPPLGR